MATRVRVLKRRKAHDSVVMERNKRGYIVDGTVAKVSKVS